jgi:hypothetical protein
LGAAAVAAFGVGLEHVTSAGLAGKSWLDVAAGGVVVVVRHMEMGCLVVALGVGIAAVEALHSTSVDFVAVEKLASHTSVFDRVLTVTRPTLESSIVGYGRRWEDMDETSERPP